MIVSVVVFNPDSSVQYQARVHQVPLSRINGLRALAYNPVKRFSLLYPVYVLKF